MLITILRFNREMIYDILFNTSEARHSDMKLLSFILVLLLPTAVNSASLQAPHIQIYFDTPFTGTSAKNCPYAPPMTRVDSFYVVAKNFDAYISAIEYSVDYPPEIYHLGDITDGLAIGSSATGIAIAWPLPQNAFFPLVVAKALFVWDCQECWGNQGRVEDRPLCANVHPGSGYLRAIRWPDNAIIQASTGPACICPHYYYCPCPDLPVAVETTTWGQIKALYK
jgi:hypothetical protein